jgi:hypothetical protein
MVAQLSHEARNLANLGKHAAKCLLQGRFPEAGAAFTVMGWRAWETLDGLTGAARVACPFCGWTGRRFKTFLTGPYVRRGAVCPDCLSLERHRDFVLLFRKVRPFLSRRIRVLDIAPTRAFGEACRKEQDIDYVSIDKVSRLAMAHMDVQTLALRDDSFDVVVCYHVLDYVADDRAAIREIRRVLKPRGMGVLQEQVDRGKSTEEWGAARPAALDRIRQYGEDFPERLRQAGLTVRPVGPETFLVFKEPSPLIELATSALE